MEHEWGTPVDAQRVLDAHPSPAIIAAVHAETSTGVRSDVAALGAGKGDALLVVDAVTSIAGIELRADDWGVDVGYAGTQKCLGVAPGLAPFTINDRAFERRVEKPQSWYLDLGLLGGYVGEASGVRRPDLPPHGAGRDGRLAARRARPDPRRGTRGGLGAARRGRAAAAGRPGGDGPDPVRREGQPAARADHRARARGRRLRRGARLPARAARHRDRRGSRAPTRRRSGGSG